MRGIREGAPFAFPGEPPAGRLVFLSVRMGAQTGRVSNPFNRLRD